MKTIFKFLLVFSFFWANNISAQCPTPYNVNNTGCYGATKPISAQSLRSDNVTYHRWYTTPTGSTTVPGVQQDVAPGSSYYISQLNKTFYSSESYYVAAVCNGVESSTRVKVDFTMTTPPDLTITVAGGAQQYYCAGETVTLVASNGSGYQWTKGGIVVESGSTIDVTSSGTYIVTAATNCGTNVSEQMTVTFKSATFPSIPSPQSKCGYATVTKGEAQAGETLYWQTDPNGTLTGAINASATYDVTSGPLYLRSKVDGLDCWSSARTVSYTVGSPPALATGSNVERCGPGSITVSASPGGGGNTIRWFSSATGGSVIGTGTTMTRTIGSTTDYYAESYNTSISCPATSRKKITATINPVPEPWVGNIPPNICYGEEGTLSVITDIDDNVSSHKWYTVPTGGTPISGIQQGPEPNTEYYISRLTKTFTSDETYYVAAVCDGTEGTRRVVDFTLNTTPALQIIVQGGLQEFYCVGQSVVLESNDGSSGQWTNSSGTDLGYGPSITVSISDTYTLAGSSTCGTGTDQIDVTFKDFEPPVLTSNVAECGQARIIKGNPMDTDHEEWYWQTDPSGEDTALWNTDDTLNISSGPLYLRSRLSGPGGFECWGPPIAVSYSINEQPEPPSNPYASYCTEGTVTLYAHFVPDITVRWYNVPTGGTSIGQGDSFVVNGIDEDTTYYAESYNQNSQCVSATRTPYEVIYGSGQPSNVFGSNVSFCDPGNVTLEVYMPNNADEVRWYQNREDVTPIATGLSFTTPIISETTTYYLEGVNTVTGCVSPGRLDIQAVKTTPRIWYSDEVDGDGKGDPSKPSALLCEAPPNYVGNDDDNCPDFYDPSNDCDLNPGNLVGDNYVYSRSYQKSAQEMLTEESIDQDNFDFFTSSESVVQQITYFDGLGRNMQSIGLEQSPLINGAKKDIVTHMEYDDFGRMEKEWLPYASSNGDFGELKVDPKEATLDYYDVSKYENTINPFSQKEMEFSPQSRVLKQAAPGADWALGQGHEIEFNYESNTSADEVRQFDVSLTESTINGVVTYNIALVEESPNLVYGDGELYKTITFDENHDSGKNHSTEEFKDKQGRVVLKRTYADFDVDGNGALESEIRHDTYYVYDDYGNLTYVLPPKMDATTATLVELQGALDELGYQYVYDHRNRLVEKKIPGKGWEYIVYNKLDQPIMTQDSVQRATGEWLFTKYDAFGRVAYTGKSEEMDNGNPSSRTYVQSQADAVSTDQWVSRNSGFSMDNMTVEYDSSGYPNTSITEVLTVNYYDDYGFDPSDEPTPPSTVFDASLSGNVKGLATGSKIKVLDADAVSGQETWITTITRYDQKGRPIYTYSENDYLGTTDIVETDIDFVGKPITVRSEHTRGGDTIVTIDNFEYDHVGRLLKQTQCIGDGALGYNCEAVEVEVNPTLDDSIVTTGKIATESITVIPSSTGSTTLSGTLTLRIDPNATSGGGTSANEELIAYNAYDELGQLEQKKVGGSPDTSYDMTDGLQTVDYAYNVRGWLTGINNLGDGNLFAMSIGYNKIRRSDSGYRGDPLYNGNISNIMWKTANDGVSSTGLGRYQIYFYDALNRIKEADYAVFHASGGSYIAENFGSQYLLKNVSYDKNGNILSLERTGSSSDGTIDDLQYDYYSNSNQLAAVTDLANGTSVEGFKDGINTGNDYEYDGNGNLVRDLNKGIGTASTEGIEYNHLNLPTNIVTSSGNISYVYDAVGKKLEKNAAGSVTQYAGNYIYSGPSGSETLQFMSQPEGYVTPNGMGGYDYVYQYKDHLGNIRLSYVDDGNGGLEIVEESNYYPFGLKHKGYNDNGISSLGNDVAQKWSFLGQERQDELGLNWIAFRHRNYMPEIGRFFGVDPVAGDYVTISPYQFAHNNPIWKIELEGLEGQERFGFDVVNAPPSGQSGQNPAAHLPLPVGDQSSGTSSGNKSTRKLVAMQKLSVEQRLVTGYPGQGLDNLVTKGIQMLGEAITGDDVTEETAGNVELGVDIIVTVTSKGKKGGNLLERLFKSGDDVIENRAKKSNIKNAKPDRPELPSLDATGKVHGDLIDPKDFSKYSPDELKQLSKELTQSVQQRIKKTSELGRDRGHGQRQGAEQDLIKSIEKYLDNLK